MQNIAGTGGAALAALPVIAKIGITAKGIGIAGGAITALAGGAASVKKGIDESKSGEEYGAWDYVKNSISVSMRTGAYVTLPLTILAILRTLLALGAAGSHLLARLTGSIGSIGGGGRLALSSAGAGGGGGAISLASTTALSLAEIKALAKVLGLAGASGIMFSSSFNGYTGHGIDMATSRGFSQNHINNIIENYSHKVYQEGGRIVYAKKVGNWYDVVILNSKGEVISTIGGKTHSLKNWKDVVRMLNNQGGFSSLPWP